MTIIDFPVRHPVERPPVVGRVRPVSQRVWIRRAWVLSDASGPDAVRRAA
jgi:hypothetical protein